MTTSPSPELFPQLTPPPGGLARLRRGLDGAAAGRRPARWRLAGAVAVAAAVVVIARSAGAGAGVGIEVFGVADHVGGASVEVNGQAVLGQPLGEQSRIFWLPPS